MSLAETMSNITSLFLHNSLNPSRLFTGWEGKRENWGGRDNIRDLLDLMRKEKVGFWATCKHGDVDLEVKEVLEVLQFRSAVMEELGDGVTFWHCAKRIDLQSLETHSLHQEEALSVLYPDKSMISITETTSSDMTLLSSSQNIQTYIKSLDPSPTSPFVLLESITGLHYTTRSLFTNNKPAASVAYHSSITRLTPLPGSSLPSRAMLECTTMLTSKLSFSTKTAMIGHLSLTFPTPENLARRAASKRGAPDSKVGNPASKIYAIDCKPTVRLGALALADVGEDLASASISVLPDYEPKGILNGY